MTDARGRDPYSTNMSSILVTSFVDEHNIPSVEAKPFYESKYFLNDRFFLILAVWFCWHILRFFYF
ncbi:unnamed protein product [Moneuplotes crassus]|uniref:Uncharacterized protein n=1 Tax=Euplotes crassus TaxID=5936 RepID=A0AAD2DAY6_EUPCR|nr:unnamed protein product [Moneuplotes crassus]